MNDEAFEKTLGEVSKLLAYVSDIDLFAECYREKLTQRLLFEWSVNYEHERSILTKLKPLCGHPFTFKMERMVTDSSVSRTNQAIFKKYLEDNSNGNPGIDLTVTELDTFSWPNYKSFDLNLPAEMAERKDIFGKFYRTEKESRKRKLTWMHSLGICSIDASFEAETIELIVTPDQAAVLLLFNSSDRLSCQEIMYALHISDEVEAVRLLNSLSCGDYKLLNKEPSTQEISATDTFEFNSKFTNERSSIKIPISPPPVEDENEKKKMKVGESFDTTTDVS